ncbi:MAG: HD domain-containing protein [Gemmatimonadota bacterium]|nr:HD domain-containing protein [Gemmatimonadota bacterium]
MSYRRIWDPLYGRIALSEFEAKLLALPEVQRLRYIRMCNINSLLITGASEISRFEHTIGVLHLANEWADENGVDQNRKRDLLAAAVLHDVLTGPFGHSFQYVLEDATNEESHFLHEDVALGAAENYYKLIPTAAQFAGVKFGAPELLKERWEQISKIIDGSGSLGPILAGTMDLDNLDNVVRLAYHAGLAGQEDIDAVLRIARGIQPGSSTGYLRTRANVVDDIVRWQGVRKGLYEFLLLDWAEFSAKAMLTRAVERAMASEILGVNSWSYTDDELLRHLEETAIGEYQDIADLVRRIRCGDLYWPMWLGRSNDVSQYKRLSTTDQKEYIIDAIEARVLRAHGMSTNAVFHLILDVGKTERAVNVELWDGQLMELGTNSNSLLVGVFLSRPWSEGTRKLVDAQQSLHEILVELGLGVTEPLNDPMKYEGLANDSQLTLL